MGHDKKNQHNAELQRADPGIKSRGNSVLGVGFSNTMPKIKMDFHFSDCFSKFTKFLPFFMGMFRFFCLFRFLMTISAISPHAT